MSTAGGRGATKTVTMYRRVRKGFVPPRRVDEVTTSTGGNGVPKKERDLSPVFDKLLKKLEVEGTGGDEGKEKEVTVDRKKMEDDEEEEAMEEFSEYFKESEEKIGGFEEDEEMEVEQVPVVPVTKSEQFAFKKPFPFKRQPIKGHFNVGLGMEEDDDDEEEENEEEVRKTFPQTSQRVQRRIQSQRSQLSQSQGQSQVSTQEGDDKKYYSAVYGKASTKKHKTYEDDGFVTVTNGVSVSLLNSSGKVIESSRNYVLDEEVLEGSKHFKMGGKEVLISEQLPSNPFAKDVKLPPVDLSQTKSVAKLPTPLISKPFISPLAPGAVLTEKANKNPAKPMFNPEEDGALVMPVLDPSEDVRVVVDPHLTRHLREHQRDGVTFLYKCVMDPYYSGAILGDEMGLGKTLQTITLLWTLLRQGPKGRKEVVKRALIVTPSSLVMNWDKEFHRWLGHERIKVFAVNSDHPLKHCPPQCPVIIISYEMATRSEEALKKMRFDLLICDEAHKIKNKNGQAYLFLSKMNCRRRILLTGTPVQNDLMELYALVNFANPGVLGTEQEFRKEYEKPIEKYQEGNSSLMEKQTGQAKALQLNNILNNFFLRRTHNVMLRYLPPRLTFVIICKPSSLQVQLYKRLLSLNVVQDLVKSSGNNCSAPLSVILALKKLCNHPNLVHPKNNNNSAEDSLYGELAVGFPQDFRWNGLKVELSGKMKVLLSLLKRMKEEGQKVVVVSHYTQTLDLLEELCNNFGFGFKRLDGTTVAKQRQQIVDQFNNGPKEFAFLLSSKAGGLGLNLQGASNIILYDIDWNPAHDIQAMSRCWRPGQKKVTQIYRLITGGSIEERIYHRQIAKQDLSGSVMDLVLGNSTVKFSKEELKDIFSFWEGQGQGCLTHELIECGCGMEGKKGVELDSSVEVDLEDLEEELENVMKPPKKKKRKGISTMAELNSWEHHGPPFNNLVDLAIQEAGKDVQFVFCSRSLPGGSDSQ